MAHERLRFPDPAPPGRRSLPQALREPLRAATLGAAVITAGGALLPFMRIFKPGTGWFDITGFQQTGDGGFVLELAIVAGVLVWVDGAWNSKILALVAGPAVLGGACILILRDYYQTGIVYLAGLTTSSGYGGFGPGFWIAVAGAVALTVTATITTWRARNRLSFRAGATLASVAGVGGGVVGAIAGFVAGSTIAPLLVRGTVGQASTVGVIAAIALAFLGAWFGAMVASSAARGLRRS